MALSHAGGNAPAAFNDPDRPFINGDIHFFPSDYNDRVPAWPFHPDQAGKNRFNETDVRSKSLPGRWLPGPGTAGEWWNVIHRTRLPTGQI